MKRDMELIRKILFYIEDNYNAGGPAISVNFDGYTSGEIYEHCLLAYDSGLIQKFIDVSTLGGRDCMLRGLSNAGYDYLDKIRDEGTWRKTIKTITEKGLDMSINTIKTISTAFITAAAEGVANSIIKNGGQV